MFQPYVVGQSGTERPESVLVTKLPARIRRIVQPTTKRENLWSIIARQESRKAEGRKAGRQEGHFLPFCLPAFLPFCLVRRLCRRRLEHEIDFLAVLRGDRDALRHRAELLVPRFDR